MDVFAVVDDDKMRRINRDITEMKKHFEVIAEADKKLQRMLKELDMNHLIRMIQTKAEDKEV